MRRITTTAVSLLLVTAAPEHAAAAKKCPVDSVKVGAVCVDKYEASVWTTTDSGTIKKIQQGKIDEAGDLAGAVQLGASGDDYGVGCADNGNGCTNYYAASVPGVLPSVHITWFQAAAACRNSGKRLVTSYEWQMAALGTPNPATDNGTTDCNTSNPLETRVAAGSRADCVSDVGAFDTVGNVVEMTADWDEISIGGGVALDASFDFDLVAIGAEGGGGGTGEPGSIVRGGGFGFGPASAGVFTIGTLEITSTGGQGAGFRCAR
jgi:hypothetical protein